MKAPKTPTKKLRFKLPLRRKPKGQHELVLTRAADVKAERVHWLWPGRIARGSVTIIAGEPGLGKSLIAARLAATVSRGRKWPCKEGSAPGGDVILIIAEDGSADTVRPRLEAAGANLKKVHILRDVRDATTGSRPFNLLDDLERLDRAVENTETPRVVIIDPWSAFLTAVHGLKFNPNDVAQVRGLMGRLDALAKKHDVGVVLIGHPSKARSGSALSRVAGSSAFVAAARAAFVVMRGEAGSKWRVFAPAKNNLGRDVGALQFRIREQEVPSEIRAPYIVWNKNRLQITADEALTHSGSSTDRQAQQREIDDFLQKLLATGKRAATEVLEEGEQHGFSRKQLHTAAKRVGVEISNTGYGKSKKWWWKLKTSVADRSVASEDKPDEVADNDRGAW
jgi:putative DNA primase/helicase